MTIFISPLFRTRARHRLLRLPCAFLLTAAWATAHAGPAPFWMDAETHARAGRILASGSEMRSLLATGDRVLVQWPKQEPDPAMAASASRNARTDASELAVAAESTEHAPLPLSHPADGCLSPMAAHYRILRTLSPSARAGSAWRSANAASTNPPTVLVQPIGTARLATQHAAAPQAMVDILQAADAIRPGDLLLALDSAPASRDTAGDSPFPCPHP